MLVVDNGSTDGTADVLEDFARRAPMPVVLLREPAPGLSRARNVGWRAARGGVIAFTDDDCYPDPEYIDRIHAVFDDASLGYAGGAILLHDPEDYPITILTGAVRVDIPARTVVEPGVLQGANMVARRPVLDRVGGFDEGLGAGTPFPSEDIEFACQASFAGFAGAYDPRLIVRHHHRRRTLLDVRTLQHGYAAGRGAYYMKCLLDPVRRETAIKTWYWRARYRTLRSRWSHEYISGRSGEIAGALRYWWARPGQSAANSR